MKLATGCAVLTFAAASVLSAPTFAALESHGNASNPAARCQGSLPVFETALRKRPLAVQNEGTSATFVTCAFEYDAQNAEGGPTLLDTYFTNNTGTDVEVTCAAVSGYQGGVNQFVSRTVELPAESEEQGNLFWFSDEFEDDLADGLIAISCQLPVGVGVNDTYIYWEADDGGAVAPPL